MPVLRIRKNGGWEDVVAPAPHIHNISDIEGFSEFPDVDMEEIENIVDEKVNNINFPVNSVNGKTGAVVLTANDVGAITEEDLKQVDFNQNNSAAIDYIKNRTHWIESIDFEWSGNISFSATENLPSGDLYYYAITPTDKFFNCCTLTISGTSFTIPVNTYKWQIFPSDSFVSIGPGSVCLLLHNGTLYIYSTSAAMENMGTYEISDCGVVNQLSAVYIPSSIARKSDVTTQIENISTDLVTVDTEGAIEGEANPINADTLGGLTLESIMLKLYPVGAIYTSTVSTDPGTLFGGTWERIQDTFLLAAGSNYAAGSTGGEATHTLTVDEIPPTNIVDAANTNRKFGYKDGIVQAATTANWHGGLTTGSPTSYASTDGGGAAHNNMPPYIAVYIWKRTA